MPIATYSSATATVKYYLPPAVRCVPRSRSGPSVVKVLMLRRRFPSRRNADLMQLMLPSIPGPTVSLVSILEWISGSSEPQPIQVMLVLGQGVLEVLTTD